MALKQTCYTNSETGSGLRVVLRSGCVVSFQIKCNHVGFSFYICRCIVNYRYFFIDQGMITLYRVHNTLTSQCCWHTLHFLLQHMLWMVSTQMNRTQYYSF